MIGVVTDYILFIFKISKCFLEQQSYIDSYVLGKTDIQSISRHEPVFRITAFLFSKNRRNFFVELRTLFTSALDFIQ